MASARYLALLDAMRDLHVRKSAGYAGRDNPDAWANFRLSEQLGVDPFLATLVRTSDKWSRVCALVRDPANEQVSEPLVDTLMDLAAYAMIAVCLYREREEGAEGAYWPSAPLPPSTVRLDRLDDIYADYLTAQQKGGPIPPFSDFVHFALMDELNEHG